MAELIQRGIFPPEMGSDEDRAWKLLSEVEPTKVGFHESAVLQMRVKNGTNATSKTPDDPIINSEGVVCTPYDVGRNDDGKD